MKQIIKVMKTFTGLLALAICAITPAVAQVVPLHRLASASHIVVPQMRSFAASSVGVVDISEVEVGVEIVEQMATTTMDITLTNATGARLEAEMVVPVPDGAVL